jgi:hypothetical protein
MVKFLINRFFFLLIHVIIIMPALAAQSPNTRTINFVNNCTYPVWFGLSGGGAQSKLTGTLCNSDSDCYAGSGCFQTGTIKQCFWINPQPSNGNYQLAENGGTSQVTIPIYNDGMQFIWSGVISGRTNCTATSCETADCGGGTGACLPSQGFAQPATQAEFTFSLSALDFYDVEIINGVTVPISISPNLTAAEKAKYKDSNPYSCGSPGAMTPSSPLLGACTWKFTPPSNDYRWVTQGGTACSVDTNCHSPSVCGVSFNPGNSSLFQKTCGTLIGYWTADQICGIDRNYGAPFNCSQSIPQDNFTLWNLYACIGNSSCYAAAAGTDCCGCVNWDRIGITVPPSPYTQQCVNVNPYWTTYSQPTLTWLKSACPTAYVYPFDDLSSTFTCSNVQNNINTMNYTITYCPNSGVTPPPPTQAYSYYVYVGAPFSPVKINNTITCPDPTTHLPACLVQNQNSGSTMTITGSGTHLCNLIIQSNGNITINSQSSGCFANITAASTTVPGAINLPGGF